MNRYEDDIEDDDGCWFSGLRSSANEIADEHGWEVDFTAPGTDWFEDSTDSDEVLIQWGWRDNGETCQGSSSPWG